MFDIKFYHSLIYIYYCRISLRITLYAPGCEAVSLHLCSQFFSVSHFFSLHNFLIYFFRIRQSTHSIYAVKTFHATLFFNLCSQARFARPGCRRPLDSMQSKLFTQHFFIHCIIIASVLRFAPPRVPKATSSWRTTQITHFLPDF